ncbi:hypothetical protein NECAME_03085 [Necator americanus]|uniref:Uncharacterized protein n=1 Tax=Necator americanus TaxID=51031 RepID=W2T9J5_NECAM|nr:hypothetical protein NECAME_03085 [Necator americanus]ETN77667.1 hypothetical protein NECAME_03085 [Necator americanus]
MNAYENAYGRAHRPFKICCPTYSSSIPKRHPYVNDKSQKPQHNVFCCAPAALRKERARDKDVGRTGSEKVKRTGRGEEDDRREV